MRAETLKDPSQMAPKNRVTPEEALAYHLNPTPGKYEINASKPMATQRDL
jgi:malate dehydrogenase (oxaloacetate-decarboxylating)(NADP+)